MFGLLVCCRQIPCLLNSGPHRRWPKLHRQSHTNCRWGQLDTQGWLMWNTSQTCEGWQTPSIRIHSPQDCTYDNYSHCLFRQIRHRLKKWRKYTSFISFPLHSISSPKTSEPAFKVETVMSEILFGKLFGCWQFDADIKGSIFKTSFEFPPIINSFSGLVDDTLAKSI